ncbi:MAG: hypothetical protein WC529_03390 [Candidatus Margulisiibacteriota bacterium]
MNTMDNAKVIETLEKTAAFTYFTKLIETDMQRLVLFSVFPYTAAANLSDPHPIMLLSDLGGLTELNSGSVLN